MPRAAKNTISLDTETTGVDFWHGAEPFLVTIGLPGGDCVWWEWEVEPEMRRVLFDAADLRDIQQRIDGADELVLQNSKFDATALTVLFHRAGLELRWPWDKVRDTLLAGHLLASNHPHDLTSMCVEYLGWNIQKHEDNLERAVKSARAVAKVEMPGLRLAAKDEPDMPSAKEKTWKYDSWVPRTMALWRDSRGEPWEDVEGWWTACAEYANADSAATLALWNVQEQLLKERGLWAIYLERLKTLPVVAEMEERGATISVRKSREQRERQREQADEAGTTMILMAAEYGHDLELPKGASPNGSLRKMCFDVLDLPRVYDPKSKTGEPTMGKLAAEEWTLLDPGPRLDFVRMMQLRAKRCTQVSYAEGYERFWVSPPNGRLREDARDDWRVLHGSLNPTGTDTLRFSHSNPNTGNVSKQNIACFFCQGDGCDECDGKGVERFNLRTPFGPAPGREWWCFDFENIELRIPGYEAGEEKMIELFERPDDPPYFGSYHLLNASIIFPDEFWLLAERKGEFKARYRDTCYQWTKNFGFAKQYNCGEVTGDRTAHKVGAFAMVERALPKIAELNRKYIDQANRRGYVETLPDKTVDPKRGYPLLCTRNERGYVKPTEPLCYHVSGTAMWCTIKAMNRTGEKLREWRRSGFDAWMVLQVHDELVFDFPAGRGEQENEPRAKELKRLMEQSGEDISIPTPVAMSWHPESWTYEGRAA